MYKNYILAKPSHTLTTLTNNDDNINNNNQNINLCVKYTMCSMVWVILETSANIARYLSWSVQRLFFYERKMLQRKRLSDHWLGWFLIRKKDIEGGDSLIHSSYFGRHTALL